jgi:hypothetical protein
MRTKLCARVIGLEPKEACVNIRPHEDLRQRQYSVFLICGGAFPPLIELIRFLGTFFAK